MHHSGVLKILAQHFCNLYLVVFPSAFLLSDDPVQQISAQRVPLLPLLSQLSRMPSSVRSLGTVLGVLRHVQFSSSPAVALVLGSRAVCWRSSFLNLNFNPPSLNLWFFHPRHSLDTFLPAGRPLPSRSVPRKAPSSL